MCFRRLCSCLASTLTQSPKSLLSSGSEFPVSPSRPSMHRFILRSPWTVPGTKKPKAQQGVPFPCCWLAHRRVKKREKDGRTASFSVRAIQQSQAKCHGHRTCQTTSRQELGLPSPYTAKDKHDDINSSALGFTLLFNLDNIKGIVFESNVACYERKKKKQKKINKRFRPTQTFTYGMQVLYLA